MSGDPISDAGLVAYARLLAMHRIAVDPAQLRQELGHHEPVTSDEILRLAKRQRDIRAKAISVDWNRLVHLALPALAHGPEGWFLIGRVSGEEALIQRAGVPPVKVDRPGLERVWSGALILVTTREGVGSLARSFDVRWFMPQIVRHRRLAGEVLLIMLAFTLLGFASPLFFHKVIDEVLVHNTLETLHLLAFGR